MGDKEEYKEATFSSVILAFELAGQDSMCDIQGCMVDRTSSHLPIMEVPAKIAVGTLYE